MSTPAKEEKVPIAQQMGAAPTLLETAIEARRQRGESQVITRQQGEQQTRQQQQPKGDQQWTERQMNPSADQTAGPQENITTNRRVQQDPNEGEDRALSFMHKRLFGDRGKKEGEEGQQQQPKKKDEGQQNGQPAKKVEVKKETVRPLSPEDIRAMTESAAVAAATAVADRLGPKKEDTEKEEKDELESFTEDDRYNLEVAGHMAKDERFGGKYKDLPRQIKEAAKAKVSYATNWEKENQGEKINWDDEQHAEFLEKNQPKVNERDFDRARITMEAGRLVEAKSAETQKEIDDIEARAITDTLNRAGRAEATQRVQEFQKEFVPEAGWDLMTEKGRNAAIEEDPINGPIAAKWATTIAVATGELVKIFDGRSQRTGKNLFRVDPKNEIHNWIVAIVDQYEDKLQTLPIDQLTNEARQTFLPRDKYNELPAEQRKRHWTIMRDEAMWIVKSAAKENAEYERQQELQRIGKVAKSQGWRFNPDSIVTQRRKPTTHHDGIETASGGHDPTGFGMNEGNPPSSDGSAKIDTMRTEMQGENKKFVGTMMSKLFQREK